jgi:Flp pilus assembly pilin Flp
MAISHSRIWLNRLREDRQGEGTTEYALLAGLVAAVAVAIMPDMFSIIAHINQMLLTVLESALGIATS